MTIPINGFYTYLPTTIEDAADAILETKKQIFEAQSELKELDWKLNKLQEHEQSLIWMNSIAEEKISELTLSSNYENWKECKKQYLTNNEAELFYLKLTYKSEGFTVKEAKEIVNYLQHKIDYLESEEN